MAWLTRLCFIPNLCISLILATSNLSAAVSSSWATRDKCNVFNVFCLYKDFLFEIQQEHKSSGYYRDWGRKKKKKKKGESLAFLHFCSTASTSVKRHFELYRHCQQGCIPAVGAHCAPNTILWHYFRLTQGDRCLLLNHQHKCLKHLLFPSET